MSRIGRMPITVPADVTVTVNGKEAKAEIKKVGKTLDVTVGAKADAKIEITLENCIYLQNEDKKKALTNVISKFQMSTDVKGFMFGGFIKGEKELGAKVSDDFRGPIEEIENLA